ncbi:MAG: hypothetical protein KGP28_02325 [Bdellovibrionales bacterium]|nr:hypothetical protein [Bdellovibrionales bacterium]
MRIPFFVLALSCLLGSAQGAETQTYLCESRDIVSDELRVGASTTVRVDAQKRVAAVYSQSVYPRATPRLIESFPQVEGASLRFSDLGNSGMAFEVLPEDASIGLLIEKRSSRTEVYTCRVR